MGKLAKNLGIYLVLIVLVVSLVNDGPVTFLLRP